jgi:hypothetical protein
MRYLWIFSNLVETDFKEGRAGATPPPAPNTTVTPQRRARPGRYSGYCQQKDIDQKPRPPAMIAYRVELVCGAAGLYGRPPQNANYEVRLDGKLLDNWQQYATEMRVESGVWIFTGITR